MIFTIGNPGHKINSLMETLRECKVVDMNSGRISAVMIEPFSVMKIKVTKHEDIGRWMCSQGRVDTLVRQSPLQNSPGRMVIYKERKDRMLNVRETGGST